MLGIILTTAAGIVMLVGFVIFFTWMDEHSKRKARQRYERKFHFIDKYLAEMETASEKEMERMRKEREGVFQNREVKPEVNVIRTIITP